MRTTRRIAVTTAIVCAIPAVWSSTAAAVPIGLYDTAPKAAAVTVSKVADSRRPLRVIVRYHR